MIVAYKWNASPRTGSYAHDTQHEKIIRGVAIGMALIMCVLNPPNPRPRPPASGKPLGTALGAPIGGSRLAWRRGWDAVRGAVRGAVRDAVGGTDGCSRSVKCAQRSADQLIGKRFPSVCSAGTAARSRRTR